MKQILLIDDDRVFLTFIKKHLEAAGHMVTTVEDGVSALRTLTDYTPDIIFLDLILPKIDGDKLCRVIRKMAHLKNTYLVVVSAVIAELSADVSDIGADAFIAKGPFSVVMQHVLNAVDESDKRLEPSADEKSKQVLGLEHVSPRQLTRELLSRNRHLQAILESMQEGILEIIENKIVYANAAAVALIGKPLEKILMVGLEELFDLSQRGRIDELVVKAGSQMVEIGEARPIELNGRHVTVKFIPVEAKNMRSVVLITDITERKRLELQLQHSQKMEAIGTIASGVAHNFRNTLTGILVNSQAIQENYQDDAELQEVVRRIDTSVKRGAQLVERLMQFARKETTNEFKPLDLVTVIAETYQIIRKSTDRKIDIRLDIRHSLPVLGDKSGLSQALMNLFTNATDAMPAGGGIKLEALRNGRSAVVRISDTGEGMSEESRKRCFDPFFTTKEVGKGTGLGLSTTYGIIKSHAGEIAVVSSTPEGTTFEIRLPLAESGVDQPASDIIMGKGQSVLVVEKNSEFDSVTNDVLECLGYRPSRVTSIEEAIEKNFDSEPDVILVDGAAFHEDDISRLGAILSGEPNSRILVLATDRPGVCEPSVDDRNRAFRWIPSRPIGIFDLSRHIAAVLTRGGGNRTERRHEKAKSFKILE
jgi:PAS domain S-box-containing protein